MLIGTVAVVLCGCVAGVTTLRRGVSEEGGNEEREGGSKSSIMNIDGFGMSSGGVQMGKLGANVRQLDDDEALIIESEALAEPDSPLCTSLKWTTAVMAGHDWSTCVIGEWTDWATTDDDVEKLPVVHYTEYVGCVHSPKECIELVQRECPVTTFATIDLDGSGDCYCQVGLSELDDDGKVMKSCRINEDPPANWMDPAEGGNPDLTWGRG
jgi:hypothetical protein